MLWPVRSCTKTTQYLILLMSFICHTKWLTKERLGCVYSMVKKTCWDASPLHVESQLHVSQYKNELWSYNPPVATSPSSTLWGDAALARIPHQCYYTVVTHCLGINMLLHHWLILPVIESRSQETTGKPVKKKKKKSHSQRNCSIRIR